LLASEGFAQTASLDSHRSLAMQLQTALLPSVPEIDELEVCWRYHPAGDQSLVGGDWYDVVRLRGGRVAVFVGDVVGHGNEAAALMGEIRFTIRGLLRGIDDPAAVLDELDRCLQENHRPSEALATICAVVLSPDGTMQHATAGHPQPVVRRSDGSTEPLDGPGGRMIGLDPGGEPRPTTLGHLAPGETLLAFSDGLFERRGEDYDTGYERLRALVEAGPEDLVELCDAAVSRAGTPGARRDDVVIVAVRRRAGPGLPPSAAG
jgi:serine phosphatase RsbU (regulator of sigma subunit)